MQRRRKMPRSWTAWDGCCTGRVTDERALPYLSAAYADDRGADIAAHLGEVLWQLGQRAEAERVWAEAAEVDPENQLLKATRQRLHPANK